jgi:GT2 family glycosyltransferase
MIAVTLMKTNVAVVIPNWNGLDEIGQCIDALQVQTYAPHIIVVENGSTDGSLEFLQTHYPSVEILPQKKNLGFAGGVNAGIRRAMKDGYPLVALLNNDAIAHKDWLKHLVASLENNAAAGIATCKLLSADKSHTDSTGDLYTTWGLPYPRDRGVVASKAHDKPEEVFGASGGASLYRSAMLEEIGLFDEDFFAYYEDVDISFRAQLTGWKVLYEPKSEVYHQTGATSGKIKGFTTYQTFKNYPLLLVKNVPARLLPGIFIRFSIAYDSIYFSSLLGGRGWPATKGFLRMLTLLPKKLAERRKIQKTRKVSVDYINSILVHDLPPNAAKLRKLRAFFMLGRGDRKSG